MNTPPIEFGITGKTCYRWQYPNRLAQLRKLLDARKRASLYVPNPISCQTLCHRDTDDENKWAERTQRLFMDLNSIKKKLNAARRGHLAQFAQVFETDGDNADSEHTEIVQMQCR